MCAAWRPVVIRLVPVRTTQSAGWPSMPLCTKPISPSVQPVSVHLSLICLYDTSEHWIISNPRVTDTLDTSAGCHEQVDRDKYITLYSYISLCWVTGMCRLLTLHLWGGFKFAVRTKGETISWARLQEGRSDQQVVPLRDMMSNQNVIQDPAA